MRHERLRFSMGRGQGGRHPAGLGPQGGPRAGQSRGSTPRTLAASDPCSHQTGSPGWMSIPHVEPNHRRLPAESLLRGPAGGQNRRRTNRLVPIPGYVAKHSETKRPNLRFDRSLLSDSRSLRRVGVQCKIPGSKVKSKTTNHNKTKDWKSAFLGLLLNYTGALPAPATISLVPHPPLLVRGGTQRKLARRLN